MSISPFLFLNFPCDETLQRIKEHLVRAGLHPVQTFDLHTARLGLHDCPCPNHGTAECDCQMVVLLVYDDSVTGPATLILHGNGGMSWLSIAEDSRQDVEGLSAKLKRILETAHIAAPRAE